MWTKLLSPYPAHDPWNIIGNPLITFINTHHIKSLLQIFIFPMLGDLTEHPKEADFKLPASVNDQLDSQSVKMQDSVYVSTKLVTELGK